jgi:iron complex transport system permease protein
VTEVRTRPVEPTARSAPPVDPAPRARRRLVGLAAIVLLLCVISVASIAIGTKAISVPVIWEALTDPTASDVDHFSVRDLRVPRTVVGLVVGAALGVSGALIQALTRNPLADPGILGVNAGAAFAVTVAVGFLGVSGARGYLWFAFLGAFLVTLVVLLIGGTGRGQSPAVMVLAGIAVGAVLGGVTRGITLLNPGAFDLMRSWNAGSIAGRSLDVVWAVAPFLAVAFGLALVVAPSLNAFALGDEVAAAQGVSLARTRVVTVVAIAFLAGGATAVAGPIGFVGLMVPHVARWIVGPDHRWIIVYSALLAPGLLLASDILGRLLMHPGEIPVGLVTAFVGAPVLIVLVRRRRASGL